MKTVETGNKGEVLVVNFLAERGYKIIAKNWKRKAAEIDIVALKNNTVYFVEVKTRSSNMQGDGFDYVTNNKIRHMQRGAELWVMENRWDGPYELIAASVCGGSIDLLEV